MNVYMVIKFKNLGAFDSVEEHKNIIMNKGYVWAGWWAHLDETLLFEKISELKRVANKEGINVFLLNSETNELYSTHVTDLEFLFKEKKESPEPSSTPLYYQTYNLYMWFKITSIAVPISHDSVINGYSYCNYSEYRTSIVHDYSIFNNKVVNRINELSQQPRTIFFLRESLPTDNDNDIRLIYHSDKKQNFMHDYSLVAGNTLLLLSDLHFSETTSVFNFKECNENSFSLNNLSDSIIETIGKADIANIIIAGDFTWSGTEKEFKKAEQFLFALINEYRIDKTLIGIIPGNHDIKFNENEYKEGDIININYTEKSSKLNYEHFYKQIYGLTPNKYLALGRRIMLRNCLPIDIVCLNSNCLQQNKNHFRGMGYVGTEQLRLVEEEMNWYKSSYSFKILVLHHHIYPIEHIVEPKPNFMYSLSLDAGLISSFIVKHKINLVIHGHKHKEHFLSIGNKNGLTNSDLYYYNVLSLGSTSSSHIAHNAMNSFALLDFNEKGSAYIKVIQVNNSDNNIQRTILQHKIPLF